MTWDRLIRFEDSAGTEHFGDPILRDESSSVEHLAASGNLEARVLTGLDMFSLSPSNTVVKVARILPLLSPADVPIVKCVGLNYMKHIKEGGRTPPPYPSIFIKPRTCIAGYNEDIPIPKLAQDDQLDYKGELSIVIGKTGKNIPAAQALSYILGFVASNDVSARKWQRDPVYAGGVPQWCFSKGFDKFAPVGAVLVSPRVVGDAGNLRLRTLVNGEVRQDSRTSDLLFKVEAIVEFVSRGTTLEAGTVIMTGTPAGVAMGMKEPVWLRDGDVVEVEIEGVGSVRNRMVFE